MVNQSRRNLVKSEQSRQQALIERVKSLGYSNSEIESIIGVGRLKPSRKGEGTTGERVQNFLNHKYAMSPAKQAILCAAVFADAKLWVSDDFWHWRLPEFKRQALAPLLAFSDAFGASVPTRRVAREFALRNQEKLSKRRRNERDQLKKITVRFVERLSTLIALLDRDSNWTNNHPLFTIQQWSSSVQLDVVGDGNSYFVYMWDQSGTNPFAQEQAAPQPLVFHDELFPKGRFQSLLVHLQEALGSVCFDRHFSSGDAARVIRKHARSTQNAVDALLRYTIEPRMVSWCVLHPICTLDEQWWEEHPTLSPVLIRYRLADGSLWTPLPESQTAQPILFRPEHNTSEKRFVRFLELLRDAAGTIFPDPMIDIGADLIGMDAGKSLLLIGRHG